MAVLDEDGNAALDFRADGLSVQSGYATSGLSVSYYRADGTTWSISTASPQESIVQVEGASYSNESYLMDELGAFVSFDLMRDGERISPITMRVVENTDGGHNCEAFAGR